MPNIDEKYINSFIRGYFDGDGCITIKNDNSIVVSICCNSKLFLENLQEKLQNNNIFSRILTEKRKHNNLYVLYLKGRKNQLNFKNYIYNNYMRLKRKYDKFMKIPC